MRRGSSRTDARRGSRIARLHPPPAAILAAGGTGQRLRDNGPAGPPKQFLDLDGRPLLARSFELLLEAGCDPVVVVVPETHLDRARSLVGGSSTIFVAGGSTRQASVWAGLQEVNAEHVVIHDAARPLASAVVVEPLLQLLGENEGAIPAIPLRDTIKRVRGGRVVETMDRSELWSVQTPQAFRTPPLVEAHRKALNDLIEVTDDAALIEAYGGSVAVIPGAPSNIKITTLDDLTYASMLLKAAGS